MLALFFHTKNEDFASKAQGVKNNIIRVSLMAPPIAKKVEVKKELPLQETPKPIVKKTPPKKVVPLQKVEPKQEPIQEIQPIEEVKEEVSESVVAEVQETSSEQVTQTAIQQVQEESHLLQDQRIAKQKAFYSELRALINKNKTYPNSARRRSIQGDIEMKFSVTSDGNVGDIKRVHGHHIFEASAREAIEKSFPIRVEKELFSYPKEFKITLVYVLK
jgi:protein TonB